MVKIRLRRKGKKFHPVYDIVAMHSRARRNGAYLERLGYYDPNVETSVIKINHERTIYWLNCGAQPTDITRLLLSYDGVLLRRFLQGKGKTAEEIETEVEKHKSIVAERYKRRKQLRIDRAIRKIKEEEKAKQKAAFEAEEAKRKAEEEAAAKAAAEAAAAETPAEAPAES